MATRKASVPKDEQLEKQDFPLFDAIAALDRKDYTFYDKLPPEQQKKFTSFMLVSHSGTYVSLGLMLFGLMSFGLMSFGLLSFGLMLFVLLSAYPSNPLKKIMHLGSLNNLA